MQLDWEFAWSVLPLIVVSILALGAGMKLNEMAGASWPISALGKIFLGLGILGMGLLAVLMLLNLFGPIFYGAWCLFQTCN